MWAFGVKSSKILQEFSENFLKNAYKTTHKDITVISVDNCDMTVIKQVLTNLYQNTGTWISTYGDYGLWGRSHIRESKNHKIKFSCSLKTNHHPLSEALTHCEKRSSTKRNNSNRLNLNILFLIMHFIYTYQLTKFIYVSAFA